MTTRETRSQRAALVALLRNPKDLGLTQSEIRARLDRGETPLAVLTSAGEDSLFPTDTKSLLGEAERLIEEWEGAGEPLVAFFQPDYPQQLATAFDYPFVLFYAGTLRDDFKSIAIVGSRSPSPQSLTFARTLSTIAAHHGITVVSGLAQGIDTAAHEATLQAGGRTVAVIGTALSRFYPPQNEGLQRQIMREGLVVSQFWPGSGPTRSSFPIRNATMSAYSALTVIVEAGEKSGTRIQAAAAVRHGRPLVLAERVATSTSWGRKYVAEGYDVTVVSSPEAAFDTVEAILSRPSQIVDWVDGLTPAA